ncbi:MAG: aminotransferase class V-fold PLP-dependent enzyme [Robiginitomaculum sp.]|nr:aminotransferase class V-fold PLP-dependent enzyme [Robiginitomaculum sp.]
MTNTILKNQRHLFDMPDDIAYLNCAYMSPLMTPAVDAAGQGIQYKVQPWTYGGSSFFTYTEQLRALAAKMINTKSDNVALVPSASYGIQVAANNISLSRGGEILVLKDQFPSHIYPWREKAKACGGKMVTVERRENGDWTKAVLDAVGARTEIVALPATHWADGGYLDVEIIGKAARDVDAKLVLDLTQSLGAMPFDVQAVQPDFMVAAGYKWLMGPYTLAYLYVAPEWQDGVPLEHNWMNRKGSEDFSRLVDYQDAFQPGARRFDMGEKSNPAQVMAACTSLQQLLDWGVENISHTLGARNARVANTARQLGLHVTEDNFRSPHYVALQYKEGVPDGLAEKLAAQNIFVSVRGNAVRITPHLYNTDTDIERLFAGLGYARARI